MFQNQYLFLCLNLLWILFLKIILIQKERKENNQKRNKQKKKNTEENKILIHCHRTGHANIQTRLTKEMKSECSFQPYCSFCKSALVYGLIMNMHFLRKNAALIVNGCNFILNIFLNPELLLSISKLFPWQLNHTKTSTMMTLGDDKAIPAVYIVVTVSVLHVIQQSEVQPNQGKTKFIQHYTVYVYLYWNSSTLVIGVKANKADGKSVRLWSFFFILYLITNVFNPNKMTCLIIQTWRIHFSYNPR